MPTLASLVLTALPFVHLSFADHALYSGSDYQNQAYGLYPNQSYQSSNLSTPIFQVNTAATDGASNNSHVFISPRGKAVGQSSPMIFNSNDLSLVWADPSYGQTFGVRVQDYNGKDYITFWRGVVKSTGFGTGSCYLLDSSYKIAYNVTTSGLSVGSDIHECQLTDKGTALLTAYEPTSWDLSEYGIDDGWIADSIFQEVDIATGNMLFEWRASDYYPLNASYADPGSTGISADSPYDFFHINSIEKDDSGNYLISARHVHAMTYINGSNGDVIWHLGGKLNDFEDLSNGDATNFAWQHDARWMNSDLTEMTFFDNGAADWVNTEEATRGMWISLDYSNMSVSLIRAYMSPESLLSISQGSVQPLSNGNIFMGYGSDASFLEYTKEGDVVWDVQFGINGNTSVQSYRAYKMNWQGFPSWSPSIATASTDDNNNNATIYMSWNGATEIHTWALLASNSSSAQLINATDLWRGNITKSGFETNISIDTSSSGDRYFRAAAVDADGKVLGASGILNLQDGSVKDVDSDVDLSVGGPSSSSGDKNGGDSSSSSSSGSSSTSSASGSATAAASSASATADGKTSGAGASFTAVSAPRVLAVVSSLLVTFALSVRL
ncbi:hypothetical protein AAFC00_005203 [Neodothiora populina]|uniref:ASST-domain-containing protein n=1 Tax=Neodothiora populina TaxID=2781224 RepID=A0ABR3PK39_9PEZI